MFPNPQMQHLASYFFVQNQERYSKRVIKLWLKDLIKWDVKTESAN